MYYAVAEHGDVLLAVKVGEEEPLSRIEACTQLLRRLGEVDVPYLDEDDVCSVKAVRAFIQSYELARSARECGNPALLVAVALKAYHIIEEDRLKDYMGGKKFVVYVDPVEGRVEIKEARSGSAELLLRAIEDAERILIEKLGDLIAAPERSGEEGREASDRSE